MSDAAAKVPSTLLPNQCQLGLYVDPVSGETVVGFETVKPEGGTQTTLFSSDQSRFVAATFYELARQADQFNGRKGS